MTLKKLTWPSKSVDLTYVQNRRLNLKKAAKEQKKTKEKNIYDLE